MFVLLIAIIALALSYVINRVMLKLLRENAVIFGAPVFEELLKTIPAYFTNRSVFHVHLLFGIGEALYDLFSSNKESGKWVALISVISHSLFGAIAYWVLLKTNMILLAVASAILVHFAWNFTIMRIGCRKV